ncbi:hypothetical protein [Actinoplanes sp. CA-252034]|uniref:hypothetical protein n=1 Tax=Actinoplanes sp. CA-252034 TaxID=3239906 RepID=UPI003D99EDDE
MGAVAMLGLGLAVFVAPSPAAAAIAAEDNVAVAASKPSDTSEEIKVAGATVYFVDNGDTWFIQDTAADGRSAIVLWENYINFNVARFGTCANKLGNGKWGKCTKDYVESSGIYAQACTYDFGTKTKGACSEWKVVKGEIIP